MKLANKIAMGVALAAVGLTTLAGSVQAGTADMNTKGSLSYGKVNVNTPGNDFDGNVAILGLEGEYASGFSYDFRIVDGDVEGDYAAGDFGFQYLWGKFGVAGEFAYAENGGTSYTDRTSLGAVAQTEVENITLSAKLLSDVNKFGDDYELTLGADFDVTPILGVSLEAGKIDNDRPANFAELTAEYELMNGLGVKGALYTMAYDNDVTINTVSLGLTKSF